MSDNLIERLSDGLFHSILEFLRMDEELLKIANIDEHFSILCTEHMRLEMDKLRGSKEIFHMFENSPKKLRNMIGIMTFLSNQGDDSSELSNEVLKVGGAWSM